MKVIAVYPYEASSEGELSFADGECLYVAPGQEQGLNGSTVGWLLAANDCNCVGYIPRNYICRPTPTSASSTVSSASRTGDSIGLFPKLQNQYYAENVPVHQSVKTGKPIILLSILGMSTK